MLELAEFIYSPLGKALEKETKPINNQWKAIEKSNTLIKKDNYNTKTFLVQNF